MRLINVNTYSLESFPDERGLQYAILSHRWEDQEILFENMPLTYDSNHPHYSTKGFRKVHMCCEQARQHGFIYVWVDTCCIDRSSSAELQEAINSMFRWYASAQVCYAYLSDTTSKDPADGSSKNNPSFRNSEWFKRGWTLQELIAPKSVEFFDRYWTRIGSRHELAKTLSSITRIPAIILKYGYESPPNVLVADVMSWAKGRETTRLEDRAYSLMGLFDVNMTMLYGEGEKAFQRLLEEIIKNSEDQSVFLCDSSNYHDLGLLARSPEDFPNLGGTVSPTDIIFQRRAPHTITNEGISVSFKLLPWKPYSYVALLNFSIIQNNKMCVYGIFIDEVDTEKRYRRTKGNGNAWIRIEIDQKSFRQFPARMCQYVTIIKRLSRVEEFAWLIASIDYPMYGFTTNVRNMSTRCQFKGFDVADDQAWSEVRSDWTEFEEGVPKLHAQVNISKYAVSRNHDILILLGFYDQFVPHCVVAKRYRSSLYSTPDQIGETLAHGCVVWQSLERINTQNRPAGWLRANPAPLGEFSDLSGNVIAFRAPGYLCDKQQRGNMLLNTSLAIPTDDDAIHVNICIWAPSPAKEYSGWKVNIDVASQSPTV